MIKTCLSSLLTAAFFTLTAFNALAQTTWDGSESADWADPLNWSAGVPDATDDVTIPDGMPNDPTISTAAVAKSVNVLAGASLTVASTGSLTINSNVSPFLFANSGTVVNEGTISLNNPGCCVYSRLYNHTTGTFTNKNVLQIGNTSGSNYATRSILNLGAFVNMTGSINLSSSNQSIFLESGATFTNNAGIVCNTGLSTADSGAVYVQPGATFNNTPCSATVLATAGPSNMDRFKTFGTFNNEGLITENSSGTSNITNNTGIVQNLGGGAFTIVSGNPAITDPTPLENACCTPPNAAIAIAENNVHFDPFTNLAYYNVSYADGILCTGPFIPGPSTSATLTASGGGTYLWSTNATTASITVTSAGTYTVTVTGIPGCTSTASQTISVNPAPSAGIISATPQINSSFGLGVCWGSTIDLNSTVSGGVWTARGGFQVVSVSNPDGIVTPLVTTPNVDTSSVFYTVTVLGCWNSTGRTIEVIDPRNPGTISGNTNLCPGNTSQLTTNGQSGGVWESSNPNAATVSATGLVTPLNNGTTTISYTLFGRLPSSCPYSTSTLVTVTPCCAGPEALCKPANAVLVGNSVTISPSSVDNESTADCGLQSMTVSPNTFNCSHVATPQTVTLTVTDNNGASSQCQATVTVVDQTAPGITCPANASVPAGADCTASLASYTAAATANDNCTANPTKTQSPVSGTIITGSQIVTLTATDGANNSAACTFTVTVVDQTAPGITCPANASVPAGANCTASLASYTAAVTANDNCTASPAKTQSPVSGTSITGSQIVTLTATDAANNSAACTFTVTVVDQTAPGITCPANALVSCASAIPPVDLSAVTASDNCGAPTKSHVNDVLSNQTCANRFTVTRTYRAIDAANNSATCSQIITVLDDTAPVFSFVPANVTVQCNSIPSLGNALAAGGCDGAVNVTYIGETRADGNCPDTYTLTRRWTATDVCGNVRTASQVITVRDTQAPLFLSVPANVTVQCNAIPVVGAPTAFDNCDASVGISYTSETRLNGACPDSYTLIRRWTAMDNCGNTRTASHRITVVDTQKPTFANVPADITLQCSDPVPGVGNPTASDNCDASVTVTYLGQTCTNVTCANSYLLQRRWKATDNCGNFTQVTQTITIRDTQAPVFTSVPADMTIQCSALFPLPGTATATDNCAAYVQVVFQGEFRTDGDCLYNYTITRTWKAQDQCGNSVTASQVITVVDTQSPTFQNAPANVTVSCNNIPNPPVVLGQDNCGPATVAYQGQSQSPGDCNSGYTITCTWTATDLCSNMSTYTQTITVQGQGLEGPGGEERRLEEMEETGEEGTPFVVRLIPNPAFESVQVRFELTLEAEVTVSVSDLSGRVVHTRKYLASEGENTYQIDLSSLSGGVYLVQVQAADQSAVEKLIVLER